MKLPSLKIRNMETALPVISAGMGVRIAGAELAAASINAGGYGTIATVGIAPQIKDTEAALTAEIKKARELSNNKPGLGLNIMVALTNYKETVEIAVKAGVDYIVSGAGLPLSLPEYVGDADIALMPVVSSGRALKILIKTWRRRYNRELDGIVIESAFCGGHLGFSWEELEHIEDFRLFPILEECKKVAEEMDCHAPFIAAGEIVTKEDIEQHLAAGYSGVQIGTRLIPTHESGLSEEIIQHYIEATEDDVFIIHSPVGMPLRVLNSPLIERVRAEQREKFGCGYHCLKTCNPKTVPFCIAKAMLSAHDGDWENGIFVTGQRIGCITEITSLQEYYDTLA